MKKALLLLTLATTFSMAAFDPKIEGYITNKLQLNETTNKSWEFGKSALKIKTSTFYAELRLDKFASNASVNTLLDYAYLDSPSAIGTFRYGIQKLSPKNINGGLANTSTFETYVRIKDTGIGLLTEIAGIKTEMMYSGGIAEAATKKLGILAKLSNDISVYGIADLENNEQGIGADLTFKGFGPTLAAQIFAGKYTYGSISIMQKIDAFMPYASYFAPLNDSTDALTTDMGKNQLLAGVNIYYEPNAFFNIEYNKKEGTADLYTAGVQVNF